MNQGSFFSMVANPVSIPLSMLIISIIISIEINASPNSTLNAISIRISNVRTWFVDCLVVVFAPSFCLQSPKIASRIRSSLLQSIYFITIEPGWMFVQCFCLANRWSSLDFDKSYQNLLLNIYVDGLFPTRLFLAKMHTCNHFTYLWRYLVIGMNLGEVPWCCYPYVRILYS